MGWSVGIRSIMCRRHLSHGEIDSDIDDLIEEAEKARIHIKAELDKKLSCEHEFKAPTYTIEKRVLGYVRVNKRACKHCSYYEIVQELDDEKDRPEWAVNAKEQYYNNDI